MKLLVATVLSSLPPAVIFGKCKAVDCAQEPQLKPWLFYLPGPERAWGPVPGLARGHEHCASCQVGGLFVSTSQFLPFQWEVGEHAEVSKRAAPSALLSNAASRPLSPSLSALFPRSTFHLRPPLYKYQVGFSHCSLTKSSVKGGLGSYFILLGRVPMRAVEWSSPCITRGHGVISLGPASCTGAKTESTCFVQRQHSVNAYWMHKIN